MVHNRCNILDEGIIKYIGDCNRMKRNLDDEYYKEWTRNEELVAYNIEWVRLHKENLELDKLIAQEKIDTCFEEIYYDCARVNAIERRKHKISKFEPPISKAYKKMQHYENMSRTMLEKYYGVERFNKSWFLNISPDWKGKVFPSELPQELFLQEVMDEFYDNCNRFTKMKYVIECGSDGDFVHIHAVFELNPGMSKSNKTCISKGNILIEFRKCWDRIAKESSEGYEGLVKGRHALQTTLINNAEILKDKLNYLIEEKKPFSHRNMTHPLYPILIDRWDLRD